MRSRKHSLQAPKTAPADKAHINHTVRLNVNYKGRRVGQILEAEGTHYFEYDVQFIRTPLPLSPLRLPVQRGVTTHRDERFAGLPGLLYDSLPDGFGLSVIREHFRGKGAPQPSPLEILAYLGDRTMGALTYEPPSGDHEQQQAVDLVNAAQSARHIVELAHGQTLDPALLQAGGTAGGVQPKILASISADGTILTGADQVPDGMTPWIIKLNTEGGKPTAYAPLEHAYFQMAKDCGIRVPDTQLLTDANGVRHFAIQRFDRRPDAPNQRVHIHSYAALAGVDYQSLDGSYEHLLQTTHTLTRSHKELHEQVRRMIFNVLSHNHDDHAKNFAFQMDDDGTWQLSPAYDLTLSVNRTKGNWLSINGKRGGIGTEDIYQLADDYRIPHREIDERIDTTKAVLSRWTDYAEASEVSKPLTQAASQQLAETMRPFA